MPGKKRKWCGLCGQEVVFGGVQVRGGWFHKKCAPKQKKTRAHSPVVKGRRIHRKAKPLGSPNPLIDKITWLV